MCTLVWTAKCVCSEKNMYVLHFNWMAVDVASLANLSTADRTIPTDSVLSSKILDVLILSENDKHCNN